MSWTGTSDAQDEIVVRRTWRGTGLTPRIHEELLRERTEQRVTLLVNPKAGHGKVQALYQRWGYEKLGEQQPFPASPVFAAMMCDLTPPLPPRPPQEGRLP
ncbi:hypothetical protein [Streptomyces sp. NPDC017940]|uniref:hypothetical protein n=1 Tax=Streptomyces sp. NPDC017940 TaxID=3365017 RepID=UPI0037930780